jgi:polygalacturonase
MTRRDNETRHEETRREFVRKLAAGAGAALVAPSLASACRSAAAMNAGAAPAGTLGSAAAGSYTGAGWEMVPGILARIKAPVFPDRDFPITSYGAVGDGTRDCTDAFRQAIDACVAAGGGRVVVPAGRFLTGAIHLRSNVNLHVVREGTILFSTDPTKFLPLVLTRFEGVELMGYSPLIYAFKQENVAVTGDGTLDGQASSTYWWPWKGKKDFGWRDGAPKQDAARAKLFQMAEDNVPAAQRVFGTDSYLRPSFIQPYRCRNILISGITIKNSPMWEIHPVLCQNVTVRGVTIDTLGPNNDGCDPESCRDVLIENTSFNTGDDCIAIKSGRNADGKRIAVPSENIVIRGCKMQDGHGGVTVGSEISGGARYIFAERCTMSSPNLDRALRLKDNAARGGTLEHIYMRDCTVGEVGESVLAIDFQYEEGPNGKYVPVVRDVEMLRVTSQKSQYGLYLRGFQNAVISDVRILDCTFSNVAKGDVVEYVTGLVKRGFTENGVKVG